MLYIHKLSDLNPKSAEIESVPFVRGMNMSDSFPFTQKKVSEVFAECIVSDDDTALIERALNLLGPVLAKLGEFLARNDPVHEPVDLKRTMECLKSLALPLANNLQYGREVIALQQEFIGKAAGLLNAIPTLCTAEEKLRVNAEISAYFEKVLRSKGFSFSHQGIIFEAHTGMVRDLAESFRNGYLFHVTLEEELKKATFADIKKRIPAERLKEAEDISASINLIGEGVDQAYRLNMRMVLWAVIFYSCIKLATSR
ncbi:hypothetical protein HYY73_06635 [Candidatus Woesearchaeota archaeon]|nr:hypothetical protein [Candidatus Woesearchaeota archaeon]